MQMQPAMMAQPMVQQPMMVVAAQAAPEKDLSGIGTKNWTSGIFSCFNDVPSCIHGLICGPCQLCSVATRVGESGCTTVMCVPNAIVPIRTKLRTIHGIRGSICDDFCITMLCGTCAVCQMERELKNAGL